MKNRGASTWLFLGFAVVVLLYKVATRDSEI
jgi:hypothetical protein